MDATPISGLILVFNPMPAPIEMPEARTKNPSNRPHHGLRIEAHITLARRANDDPMRGCRRRPSQICRFIFVLNPVMAAGGMVATRMMDPRDGPSEAPCVEGDTPFRRRPDQQTMHGLTVGSPVGHRRHSQTSRSRISTSTTLQPSLLTTLRPRCR